MTTYYVDGLNGNDGHAGTSFGTAFATIGQATSVVAAGDTVRICSTATYTLGSTVTWSTTGNTTSGPITIIGANSSGTVDGTKPTITSAINSVNLFTLNNANYYIFRYLKWTHTASTRGKTFATSGNAGNAMFVSDCIVDGCSAFKDDGFTFTTETWIIIERCVMKNMNGSGVSGTILGNATAALVVDTIFLNCSGSLFTDGINNANVIRLVGCGANGGTSLINYTSVGSVFSVERCSIYGMSGDVIVYTGLPNLTNGGIPCRVVNNIAYGNTGYFMNGLTHSDAVITIDYNFLGSNTAGNYNNITAGLHDVSLSSNPFTNASGGDLSLKASDLSSPGTGAYQCKAAAFPGTFPGETLVGYIDAGAIQHQDTGTGTTIAKWFGVRT